MYNIPLGGGMFRQPWAIGGKRYSRHFILPSLTLLSGSGSTYVYGYCDATYQEGWGRDETVQFVKNTLSLAMSRDGSSGGVIRMAVITEDSVERLFVPGDQLPKFWEGREIIPRTSKKVVDDVEPMAVEA